MLIESTITPKSVFDKTVYHKQIERTGKKSDFHTAENVHSENNEIRQNVGFVAVDVAPGVRYDSDLKLLINDDWTKQTRSKGFQ